MTMGLLRKSRNKLPKKVTVRTMDFDESDTLVLEEVEQVELKQLTRHCKDWIEGVKQFNEEHEGEPQIKETIFYVELTKYNYK